MPRKHIPGIFCVEGEWSSRLTDRASVRDMLDLLEAVERIKYIHEHVNTPGGLMAALRQWRQKQYASFSLGYFAFHGRPGKLIIGRRSVPLKDIAEVLRAGCEGKTLYFGSCSVLHVPKREVDQFLRTTKAACVVGFTRDVDWLASAALDLILLEALALHDHGKIEEWLRREYGELATHLGLRMYYR